MSHRSAASAAVFPVPSVVRRRGGESASGDDMPTSRSCNFSACSAFPPSVVSIGLASDGDPSGSVRTSVVLLVPSAVSVLPSPSSHRCLVGVGTPRPSLAWPPVPAFLVCPTRLPPSSRVLDPLLVRDVRFVAATRFLRRSSSRPASASSWFRNGVAIRVRCPLSPSDRACARCRLRSRRRPSSGSCLRRGAASCVCPSLWLATGNKIVRVSRMESDTAYLSLASEISGARWSRRPSKEYVS